MLKEVSQIIWKEIIIAQNTSIFDEPEYLETIASLHNTKIIYWIIYKNEKPIIGFAVHVKNKSIIVPDHFSYSSFWICNEIGEFSAFNFLDEALIKLKKEFKFIKFRLSPVVKDIRAFNSNNFFAKVNYTYLNDTVNLHFRKDIKKKINITCKSELEFFNDSNYIEVVKQQIGDFKLFGYTDKRVEFYKSYFECLAKEGFLKSFSVKSKGMLVASSQVIIDQKESFAYNLLVSSSKSNYSLEVSAFLYDNMLKYFREHNIKTFDFYGADMKGIANFKSGFNGNLTPHYTVDYNFINKYALPSFYRLKKAIKKFF